MIYKDKQLRMRDIFSDFMQNKECVIDFIENLKIPDLNLKDFENPVCENFCNNLVINCRNKNNVMGFVIKGETEEIYVLNPEIDYIHFWNERNFFTFGLAKYFKNSTVKRYLVNLSSKDYNNSLVKFNISPYFYIWNLYKRDEKLENWLMALYY